MQNRHNNAQSQENRIRINQGGIQNSDSLPRNFEKEQNSRVYTSSLPRRMELDDLTTCNSVKKTVNYLNKLSSSGSGPVGNYHYGKNKKEEGRTSSSLRTRGPYISQITIKENPNES